MTRPALYERSATRRQMRAHDLRFTFITIALANGRTETWVADRTGHTSSDQINEYRRQARAFAELAQGDLVRLDFAIPEIRATQAALRAAEKGPNGARADDATRGEQGNDATSQH